MEDTIRGRIRRCDWRSEHARWCPGLFSSAGNSLSAYISLARLIILTAPLRCSKHSKTAKQT